MFINLKITMAVPIFEKFLYPFLYQIKDRDVTTKEMKQKLIEHFNLSEEDCALMTRGGATSQISDRINWARQYLRRALFIEIPQRGVYHITQRGKEYLQTHTDLRKADLMDYREFASFAHGSTPSCDATTSTPAIESELTPTEMLEQAYHSIVDDLAADLLQKTLDQSPQFFERLVVDLLVKMGYGGASANSHVTPYAHDDGIDGIIYEDKLGLDKIYIQAKRYNPDNTIGKPQIQQFAGALDEKRATKGVFITTSSYSRDARQYVDRLSKKIVLVDGKELARYMIEYNVGVSTKLVYQIKRIDSDYFEE